MKKDIDSIIFEHRNELTELTQMIEFYKELCPEEYKCTDVLSDFHFILQELDDEWNDLTEADE